MDGKVCKSCGAEKPVSDFYKEKSDHCRPNCKTCDKAKDQAYKDANRESVRAYGREYYQKNSDKQIAYNKTYKPQHRGQIAQKQKAYWSKPENRIRKAANKRAQYQASLHFRMLDKLRSRMGRAIKHHRKSKVTLELVGCSLEQLRSHLESQFQPGMSWDNYGEWHVDHIRPCASFDLSKPAEQQACFHYSNLQPLWGRENILKGDKWPQDSGTAHSV